MKRRELGNGRFSPTGLYPTLLTVLLTPQEMELVPRYSHLKADNDSDKHKK